MTKAEEALIDAVLHKDEKSLPALRDAVLIERYTPEFKEELIQARMVGIEADYTWQQLWCKLPYCEAVWAEVDLEARRRLE